MLEQPQRAYLCVGAIEPESDLADPALAARAFTQAACVVAITPFASDAIRRYAHVILPMAAFAETSGTYVNLEGRWQSQTGAARAPGEARPAWKVLRVLANTIGVDGFDDSSSEDVRDAVSALAAPGWGEGISESVKSAHLPAIAAVTGSAELELGALDVPMYSIDAVLRRSEALQQTAVALGSRR
jgi:NADH-quinone oxidoreductase subunit G